MFYVMTIRRSYHETEQVLIWLKSKADIMGLLDGLRLDACTLRPATSLEG
jgi:hypothetical protein